MILSSRDIANSQSLFTTPLNDYDVLLHLNPTVISTYAQAVDPNPAEWEGKTFRNLVATKDKEPVLVDYNPVISFVNDLQVRPSSTHLIQILADLKATIL